MTALVITLMVATVQPPPVVYTPPERCGHMPNGEWDACEAPESWNDFCISVTHYWPFDEDGHLVAGNGQTDSDPTKTATGVEIVSVAQDSMWVALPLPLITDGYYTTLCFPSFYASECYPGWDTFGNPVYQAGGFWHEGYEAKVIGVDVFTANPVHYLVCNDEGNPNRFRLDIYKDAELTNP